MGTAILSGVLKACAATTSLGSPPRRFTQFIACVNSASSGTLLKARFADDLDRVTVLVKENVRGMRDADVVLLGCKPYMVGEVLGEEGVAQALGDKLLISFLVGTPVEKIHGAIFASGVVPAGANIHATRAMMNIAAEYGESMTVVDDVPLPGDYAELTRWIFGQLGKVAVVASNLFDVGGILAGPSGVYLSVALDGILDGAVAQGLKRAEARKMLTQSLVGLAKLLEAGDTPDQLREKFSSPRGTTIEGLMSLEEDRVRSAYTKCIIKATKRSQEM
jgi:pyrroline-5-carboxylate reductase